MRVAPDSATGSSRLTAREPWRVPPWLALVQRFNAERDHDYEELGDQCAALVAEAEREQAKGRFTFAAPGRADAEADLERAAAAVDDFAAQVAGRADSDRPREPG